MLRWMDGWMAAACEKKIEIETHHLRESVLAAMISMMMIDGCGDGV